MYSNQVGLVKHYWGRWYLRQAYKAKNSTQCFFSQTKSLFYHIRHFFKNGQIFWFKIRRHYPIKTGTLP